MYAPLNFFEIISDYCKHMRKDFKPVPFVITLIAVPLALSFFFILTIRDEVKFYGNLITISSLLIPLLLNLLVTVYYSLERINNRRKVEIEYLTHVNSTISMTTLVAVFVLILSLVSSNWVFPKGKTITGFLKMLNLNPKLIPMFLKFSLFYLVGFLITNVIISLVRVYRLIRYEIRKKDNQT